MSRAESGNSPNQQGGGSSAQQLKDTASQVASQVRDLGSQARDAATEQYQAVRDSATEYYNQGREKAMQWEQQLEDYVREQPLKSVLIAAGVGVLLGVIWKRS